MKTPKKVSLFLFVFLVLGFSSTVIAQTPVPSAEEEVIALTYKLWDAENLKDMAFRNKHVSDDYTEFNSVFSTRIDGKTKNFKLSDANFSGGTSLSDEMLNPKVQVYGDVAILTYNFAGVVKDNDGKTRSSKAKSTRVYVKMNGEWKLVHANFGLDPTED
jgi:ketosteroid isomerase-like protein